MSQLLFKPFRPIVYLFVLINLLCVFLAFFFKTQEINPWVVASANLLLFAISMFSLQQQLKQSKNTNPHAMVRAVMSTVVLKLFVLGSAAIVYLYNAGENKSVNAIFLGMALYIMYTWMEVKLSLKINQNNKDGGN